MADAKEEEQQAIVGGMMMGVFRRKNGEPMVAFDLNGMKVAFDIENTAMIFNQLGDLLDSLGYFGDEDEEEPCPCKLH
jgi:hypothetical protein